MHRQSHVQNRVQLRVADVALGNERLIVAGRKELFDVVQLLSERQKEHFPYMGDPYVKEHQSVFTRVGMWSAVR